MVGILQGKARGGEEESILMHDLKPFRILISLLDKPELGPAILEDVLIEVFRTLHTQCRTELDLQNQSPFSKDHTHLSSKLRENKKTAELIKTANLLFNSFEPYYMWDYIAHWFEECCSADPPELLLVEFCQLVDFLLDIVSLETYIEIQTEHLPQLLLRMVAALTCHLQALGLGELTHCLRLCSKILSKVQPPLVSPLALPSGPQAQGLSSSIGKPSNSARDKNRDTEDKQTLPSTLEGPGTEDVFEDVENTPSCRSESGFTEFVQYQGDVPEEAEHTPHPHSTVRTGRRSSGPCHSKPLDKPVMQCCLEHFQQFLSASLPYTLSQGSLHPDRKNCLVGAVYVNKCTNGCIQLYIIVNKNKESLLTRIHVKSLTCFCPSCIHAESEQVRLPLWLQTLMDACCLASDFSLQCVAISLLMDLVGLTQSVAMVTAESVASGASSESTQPMSPSQGRVAVVIRPPLTQGILKHIADKTDFFKVEIWFQIAVELFAPSAQCGIFYQLHNLVPSSSICEDVISHHAQDKVSISAHITSKNQIKEIHAEACSVSISLHNAGLPELLGSICTSAVGRAWLNQTHRVSIQRVQAQRHLAQVFPEPPERSHQNPFTTETLASQTVTICLTVNPLSDSLSIMSLSSENLHLAGEYQPAHQQGEPQSSGLHWFSFFLQWKMQLEEPEGVKCMINGRKRSHSSIQLSLKGKIMEKLADKSPGAKPKIKKIKRKEEERQRKANQADKLRPPSIFFGDSLDLENWYSCGEGEVSEIESDTGSPRRRSSSHVLLYLQLYDSSRALHALSAIAAMLRAAPSGFVSAISTTSINNTYTPQLSLLQNLLARHRLPLHSFRSAMYLEIIISLCLYFLRSYYSAHVPAGPQDLVLTLLFSELAKVTGGSAKGFASFISDVLSKCKVQKVVLHCLLSSIFSAQKWHEQRVAGVNMATVEEGLSEDIQAQLLRLLQSLVVLEHRVLLPADEGAEPVVGGHVNPQQPMTSLQYLHGQPITAQGMFLCSVIRALHQHHACKMHPQWIGLITATLPYMGRVLRRVVASVTLQLCRNLDNLLQQYRYETGITDTRY
uniref:DOP1 leucine zipper like protein A n=1 Tax=Maylandia zebra TaxID=106582 RepID=A0A3P9DSS6_9CICH